MKNVIVTLTLVEAEELYQAASNGWGDGDYYEQGTNGRGGRQKMNAFLRAHKKLNSAIEKKERGSANAAKKINRTVAVNFLDVKGIL